MSSTLTISNLLASLESLGSQPALTFYRTERTELSGRVLANHMIKNAQSLIDDIWVEPGETVLLDLPLHWRALTLGLGSLLAGTHVATSPLTADIAACFTSQPFVPSSARELLAVDLHSLAMQWQGPTLPTRCHDAVAGLLGASDFLADGSLSESSNYSYWAEQPHHFVDTHLEISDTIQNSSARPRFAINTQNLATGLSFACKYLSFASLVIIATEDVDTIVSAEKATLIYSD